jgi:hypothetical protein
MECFVAKYHLHKAQLAEALLAQAHKTSDAFSFV